MTWVLFSSRSHTLKHGSSSSQSHTVADSAVDEANRRSGLWFRFAVRQKQVALLCVASSPFPSQLGSWFTLRGDCSSFPVCPVIVQHTTVYSEEKQRDKLKCRDSTSEMHRVDSVAPQMIFQRMIRGKLEGKNCLASLKDDSKINRVSWPDRQIDR